MAEAPSSDPAPSPDPVRSSDGPPATGLGTAFVRGMLWGTVGLFIGKLSSLLATLLLGWLFTSREYGTYGAALGAAMIGDILTDGGLRRVLITRGAEYPRIARTAFIVALGFNLLGCMLMFAAAPAYRLRHPDAVPPLLVTGVALVLSTLGTIQKCKQSIDMQFGQVAFMGTLSSLLRNVLTVGLAWLFMHALDRPDLAPLAFALPLVAVNLWEAAYVYWTVGRVPTSRFDARLARELIGQGKWVMFAYLGGALIYRGDYLVASRMLQPVVDAISGIRIDVLGQYVFGFQLTVALFSPLSIGMAGVIQPIMARLRDDPLRQANAFLRMVRTSLLLATPASLGAVLVTPLMIHTLWPHRPEWHACVPVIQLIAATECVRQLHPMCLATIDGRGEWRRTAILIAIDGLLTVTAALIGCVVGLRNGQPLLSLTIAVAVERTLLAVAQAIYTYRLAGGRTGTLLAQVVPPLAIATPIALLAMFSVERLGVTPTVGRVWLAVAALPAVVVYAATCRSLTPARYREAADLILSRVRRRES